MLPRITPINPTRLAAPGIVVKHRQATYGVLGPAGWFKILNPEYTQKRGRRVMFDGFRMRLEPDRLASL
jgi:hypothetical protein